MPFSGKGTPPLPLSKTFLEIFVGWRGCKIPAAKKWKAHKKTGRGLLQKSSPRTPLSKTLKHLIAGAKHLIASASITSPPHKTEPRRHGTSRAKPCLPDTAAQNPVSLYPDRPRYTVVPRKPPPVGATTGRLVFPQHTAAPRKPLPVGATTGCPQIRLRIVVAAPEETKNGRPLVARVVPQITPLFLDKSRLSSYNRKGLAERQDPEEHYNGGGCFP